MSSQWITQIDEFRHQFDELRGRSSTDELAWLKVERRLQLQYVVTRVLGESSSLDEVAPKLLQSICVIERWQFGELWVPTSDSSRLRFGDFWHASTFDAAEFIRQAKRMTFQQGQGLPGKVWVEGKPKLISDINSMSDAPRMSQALKLGFRSALASPLSSRNGFSGVMVFYSREPRAPDVDLLDLFDAISRQTRDFLLRYRAEQHLRKNEKRFRALIERSYDATVLLGTDGKILYAAPSVDRVFGYSVDKFVGRTAFEFIHPDDQWRTLRGLRLLLHKLRESVTVVYRFRHQDGSWRWMEGVGTNMLDEESVRAIVVNTRDITERKTEEEKLSRSESHLRRAQSVGKTGSWYVDLEKNTLEWSQEVYRIFGRNPWTFPATNEDFFASVHPEDREAVLAAFAESIRTGKRFEIEHRIILTDGSERIVFEQGEVTRDDRGKSVAMIGVVQDISERRRAEEELLRSAAIIASSDDAIFTKTLDGIIVSWNPGAEKIYGYSAAEIRGRPVSILAPLDRQDELPAIMTKLRKGERMDHYETVRITKEGKCIDVSLSISPLKDSQGKIVGAASIARDITERNIIVGEIRKLNEELERRVMQRTAQLEAANKELESFSYSVSHDLRAPLRAIVGFGKVLMEEHSRDLNADGQRLMKVMIDNGNRMGELIDDLLAFSRFRRQHLVLSNVDLNQIARDVFEEVAAGNKERSIRLDLRYLLPACGDPALIRQVLQNLISNAVKFTSRRDEAVVEIGCSETGREVTYYVKDNGIGFDMRYVDRLFGVFQRLHSMEEFEGTGVGLAIVKRIVERHGGRVWADARLNEGATIFFTLTNSEQIPLCSDEP